MVEAKGRTMIETKVFKIGKGRFARLLFERHGQGWLFGGVFLFMVSLILGVLVDYRILAIAFLLVCIVAPGLMLILYYNYGMKGENFINVIDHRIEIENAGMKLFLKVKEPPEEVDEKVGEEPQDDKKGKN
ncbi:MAG: hypothetical protein K2G23_08290, partial [Muribaculaceae bacterium]|nr:hypothetical protein [Muribaculaceae bacterium]